MPTAIITTDDLREFKLDLLEEIKKIMKSGSGQTTKQWLKSNEVRKMLGISPGTLQTLRINGTLPFSRMGGVIYFKQEDITKVLESNRRHNHFEIGTR